MGDMTTLLPTLDIDGLFVGQIKFLDREGNTSAIAKTAAAGRVQLTAHGLAGDEQADRRVHGDEGKALHQFPAEHLAQLQAAFPEARNLHRGGLGENISTTGVTETDICIGDRFRIGTAIVEVSQPRLPCWKIEHRTGVTGMVDYVFKHGIAGWYFRVLEAGEIGDGDRIVHLERPANAPALALFWQLMREQQPAPEALEQLANATGLEPDWRKKLLERATRLRNTTGA
jgi:MOSC domain-containing protein YiiM